MALPTILYLFVFHYLPLFGLVLPFVNFNASLGLFRSEWAGLSNFQYLFNGTAMLRAVRNTVLYNIAFQVIGTTVCIIIALMLYELSRRAVKVYQTILLLPYFFSYVIISFILKGLLDADSGILNQLRGLFGLAGVSWFNEPKYWPFILIAVYIWKGQGYTSIIYYASLMSIDSSLFEAAKIDGAGKIKQMWYISLPMLKPMIVMMTILSIGHIFNGDFGLFYNSTFNNSLLYPTTDIINTYVYRALMQLGNIGMSSAATFLQSVMGFLLVLLTNWLTRKIDRENSLF